jgi:DNA-binding response OmpR family regulator
MSEKQQRILIIHGEGRQSAICKDYLIESGYLVFDTSEAKNITAYLSQVMPDLVTLDCDLPEISRLALTRTIRCDSRFYRLPIILIGLKISSDRIIFSLEAGIDLCLEGPIPLGELSARVRALLRRASTLADSTLTQA